MGRTHTRAGAVTGHVDSGRISGRVLEAHAFTAVIQKRGYRKDADSVNCIIFAGSENTSGRANDRTKVKILIKIEEGVAAEGRMAGEQSAVRLDLY